MSIEKCKGCTEIVYTIPLDKSWCWRTAKEILKMKDCPKNKKKENKNDEDSI